MYTLPNQKLIRQSNQSDNIGEITSSFSLDLTSNPGRVRVGERLLQVSSVSTLPTMDGIAENFAIFNGGETPSANKVWTLAESKVFHDQIYADTPFQTDEGTTPVVTSPFGFIDTFFSTLILMDGNLSLYRRTVGTNTYTLTSGSAAASYPAMGVQFGGRYYFIGSNISTLYSMDTSFTVATSGQFTASVTDGENITVLLAGKNRTWVGVSTAYGKKGGIYEWDGSATQMLARYPIDASGVLSGYMDGDTPYFMDNQGKLLAYNGGAFIEVDRLPVDQKLFSDTIPFIHRMGMCTINGRINLLINNIFADGTVNQRCASGIWELDDNKKLYHKHPITYTPVYTTSTGDYGQYRLANVGALRELRRPNTAANANGTFLCSASFYKPDGTITSAIFTNDSNENVRKMGWFTTPFIDAHAITDTIKKVFLNYNLNNDTDKIVLKWRKKKQNSVEANLTWVSGNQFTTTSNITSYNGYEVMITQGGGSICARITNITGTGTYTVTIAETVVGVTAGDTGKGMFQYWKEANSTQNITDPFKEFSIAEQVGKIQLKVIMYFTGRSELERLTLANEDKQKAI